jgi:hypothetical protein
MNTIVVEGVYWMNPALNLVGCACTCGMRFAAPAHKVFTRCPNCGAVAQTLPLLPGDSGAGIFGANCMNII